MIEIKKDQVYVYIGKTMGAVHQYDRFKNGIPNDLKKMIELEPLLEKMVVMAEEFVDAKRSVETEGTILNNIFREIDKRLGGE